MHYHITVNMAQFRPAGMSDEDTDSDDEFFMRPVNNIFSHNTNYFVANSSLAINLTIYE